MKKICLWIAMAAFAASSLTGCNTNNGDTVNNPPPHPANAQPGGMPTSPASPSPNGAPVP
ncbi:MAG TPA: hypothetical protein VGN23_12145 [Verrucomicrobiae bacterium]